MHTESAVGGGGVCCWGEVSCQNVKYQREGHQLKCDKLFYRRWGGGIKMEMASVKYFLNDPYKQSFSPTICQIE